MVEMDKHQHLLVVVEVEVVLELLEVIFLLQILVEMVVQEFQLLFQEVLQVLRVVQQELVQVVEEVFLLQLGDQKLQIQQEQEKMLEPIQVLVEEQHLKMVLQLQVELAAQESWLLDTNFNR
jgi:hypothetical protein